MYETLQDTYTYSSGELRPLMNSTVSVNNAHFILIDWVEGLFFTKILGDKITFLKL